MCFLWPTKFRLFPRPRCSRKMTGRFSVPSRLRESKIADFVFSSKYISENDRFAVFSDAYVFLSISRQSVFL